MNKRFKKILGVVLSAVMLAVPFTGGASAFKVDIDYTINNPYANVDWKAVNQYKTELHCHTTATDGGNTLKEMIEKHYELGYDIMAVTDHGTTDYGWTNPNYIPELKVALTLRKGNLPIVGLNKDGGDAENGNTYTLTQAENGDQFYYQTDSNGNDGKMMMRVPFGIENNPTSFNNAHVNSWFVDYGNGYLGGTSDYYTPITNVQKLGGLSVINHPGEYTSARNAVTSSEAYNKNNAHYSYVINKYETLLMNNSTCLGIDINSKGDYRTRFDRKLWDTLLTDLVPHGRNVYAIGSSDAHNLGIVNSGYTLVLMPELSNEALKSALSNGEFFAASRYVGNYDELVTYAKSLCISNNKYAKTVGTQMKEAYESIENEISEKGKQSTIFQFDESQPNAKIRNIIVDDKEDRITIDTDGFYVRWVSGGRTVAVGKTVDLDDCENIGSYVRAEVIGKGGIVYTQAFTLEYKGAPEAKDIDSADLGSIASVFCDTIVRLMSNFRSIFDMIYKIFGAKA